MEIIKQVTQDASNISDKIQDAFAPVYPGVNLVFVEKYHKNENGELVSEVIGGIAKTPLILKTAYLNEIKNVYFEFSENEAYHRIGDAPLEKKKISAFIPIDSEIVNIDSLTMMRENPLITPKPEIPTGENIVNLYVGNAAFTYLCGVIKSNLHEQ